MRQERTSIIKKKENGLRRRSMLSGVMRDAIDFSRSRVVTGTAARSGRCDTDRLLFPHRGYFPCHTGAFVLSRCSTIRCTYKSRARYVLALVRRDECSRADCRVCVFFVLHALFPEQRVSESWHFSARESHLFKTGKGRGKIFACAPNNVRSWK